jgi:hypothetical protein
MERKLPAVMFEGTSFIVDVVREEFREMGNPQNSISFEMLVRDGDGYLIFYDPLVKNIPGPDRYQHPDIKTVEVPPLGMMDLEGMALKYGRNINDIKGKTDYEIIVDQKVVADRLAGQLPQLIIEGQTFFVDARLGTLRPKDDYSTLGIHLSALEPFPLVTPQSQRFFYNRELQKAVQLNMNTIMEIPKNVVPIQIPLLEKLDPVRIASVYQLDMQEHLMKNPPQAVYQATVVPWEQTNIPYHIEWNNRRAAAKQASESFREKLGKAAKGKSI